jgi:glycerol-3-phosphate cytidylyltransferase
MSTKNNFKVGYTSGAFDLFHIGHLNILKKAREECDELIVGVSTDKLIHSYKGRLPIVPHEERMEIISSLKCVDKVYSQTTMDKTVALKDLNFNIMFHGDDWKGSEIYNAAEKYFNEAGVEIIYFPYTKGTSSTIIKENLYNFVNLIK